MSEADAGMKSRAEKGMDGDLKQSFFTNLRRKGLSLVLLSVTTWGRGNKSGRDV